MTVSRTTWFEYINKRKFINYISRLRTNHACISVHLFKINLADSGSSVHVYRSGWHTTHFIWMHLVYRRKRNSPQRFNKCVKKCRIETLNKNIKVLEALYKYINKINIELHRVIKIKYNKWLVIWICTQSQQILKEKKKLEINKLQYFYVL